ncbi:MAG: hypothetical protein RL682_1632 [Pseudomonadota bacterium]|jgi:D-3-phosphoglycerate dehydrogenase / 2-oxoglutarate reductase
MTLPRVLYWSHAPEDVYQVLHNCAVNIAQLQTLSSDDDQERSHRLKSVDAVIVAARPFRESDLANAPSLRLIHHQGVGYHDTTPVAAMAERGIRLALTPEGTTTGVAEHTVLLMLAVCKRLCHVDAEMRTGHWHVNTYRGESREIAGMTVGYVGFGRIGQAVAARLEAFGARAIYHDLTEAPEGSKAEKVQHLEELLARADIVSLHVPLMPSTRHIINAKMLSRMKQGAILINASRGGLVDEAALVDCLRNGHLAGAGLDCFETEPVQVDHPLFNFHNVVLTPHTAAATGDALKSKMAALFDNIAGWTRTGTLRNEVKLERNPISAVP